MNVGAEPKADTRTDLMADSDYPKVAQATESTDAPSSEIANFAGQNNEETNGLYGLAAKVVNQDELERNIGRQVCQEMTGLR